MLLLGRNAAVAAIVTVTAEQAASREGARRSNGKSDEEELLHDSLLTFSFLAFACFVRCVVKGRRSFHGWSPRHPTGTTRSPVPDIVFRRLVLISLWRPAPARGRRI